MGVDAAKDGLVGDRLKEAGYINLSLHYLAQVIMALNKHGKGENNYVPYRNSMMTMVLRDSLGGNCKTKMIATINPSSDDVCTIRRCANARIDESLSTCRFARSVAKIKNDAQKNEVADPAIVIERLKKENAELRAELAMLKGGVQKDHLDPEDIDKCKKLVDEFVASKDPSATIILPDKMQINECFYHFKHMYLDLQKRGGGGGPAKAEPLASKENQPEMNDEVQRLRLLVKQRDNEILILVGLLNKRKTKGGTEGAGSSAAGVEYLKLHPAAEEEKVVTTNEYKPMVFPSTELPHHPEPSVAPGSIVAESIYHAKAPPSESSRSIHKPTLDVLTGPINIKPEDLLDRAKTFDMFRKSYRRNEAMEENKALLREKFATGKSMGTEVNATRKRLKDLTNKLEDLRKANAMRGMVDKNGEIVQTEEENALQTEISSAKSAYQKQYAELKDLKADIERIQALLERSKDRMQKDFEQWFGLMLKQSQGGDGASTGNRAATTATPTKSVQTGMSSVSSKDPKVNENLVAFYKSRDEIYQGLSKASQNVI